MRRRKETFRDLDVIATAADPAALTAHFVALPLGRRGGGARRHEGDGDLVGRPALRPARRAARVVREPPPALHRLEGPQRRAARGGGEARAFGLRVRRRDGRDRRGLPDARRGGALRLPRLRVHPARAARELRRARGGARRRAARARRARRPARRPAHAHRLVGRQGHARGDGARRARASATSTSPSATTSTACARASWQRQRELDRAAERAAGAVPDPARGRGQHPRRRLARHVRRGHGRLRVGDGVAAHVLRPRLRPSACSRRWRTRTSTASAT